MKKSLLFILLLSLFLASCQKRQAPGKPYLVVLSLDGFRWDYPDFANTPTLDSIQNIGVKAQSLKASFPTKTFPNHYTIATGLYPDHHGIVLNNFYADDLGKSYNKKNISTVTEEAFYSGEPIWTTAEKQDVTAATLFWVGSEAPVDSVEPTYWKPYKHKMPFYDRIDTLVKWMELPKEKRPQLVMWYLHEPDHTGHVYGPKSSEVFENVESLDSLLGVFFTEMRKLPYFDQINFIITSDHGMVETSDDKRIFLDNLIDTANLLVWDDGWTPNFNFKVKPGHMDEVFDALRSEPNLEVWKHGQLPERLNYGNNSRTHDISIVAKPGWSVYWSWSVGKSLGAHGYVNDFKDTHAIFYAAGPAFKNGFNQPTFQNVDIYPLMADLMNLKPAQTDGNIKNVKDMLK